MHRGSPGKGLALFNHQAVVIGAVRVVAREAVFFNRRVLPDKRPAFFRMTRRAERRNRLVFQHGVSQRAVWVVAVAAGDAAFYDRVVRRFQ